AINSDAGVVDGEDILLRTVSFTPADLGGNPDRVGSVRITVDFMKCAGALSLLADLSLPDECPSDGPAFANEIILKLFSPAGTEVSLVGAVPFASYFPFGGNGPDP